MNELESPEQATRGRQSIDFDIHGIVRIRFVDTSASNIARFTDQLGPPCASANHSPDITVRYTQDEPPSRFTYLGLNWAGFTKDGFYTLSSKTGKVTARITFENIGDHCEVVCYGDLNSVPLLFDIINLTLLKKDYVSLHASAFVYNGHGVLVTGWEKGGKTETLLAFANHGAEYVGDEWVTLSGDGREMFGIPIPVTVWQWQFKYIPTLMPDISIRRKSLIKGIRFLDFIHSTFAQGRSRNILPWELLRSVLPTLRRQLKIIATPRIIFTNRMCSEPVAPDKVLLAMGHDRQETSVAPCDPMEIAERMKSSIEYEQFRILQYYKAYKFAFPHTENVFLEQMHQRQDTLLHSALKGKSAYKVLHPYPVSFEELFDKLRPILESGNETTPSDDSRR